MPWIRDDGPEPSTVSEANFQASRLLTLRTRNSAAYKGVFALLMHEGCMDWAYRQPINVATFLDLAVDIHHIFPKAWCDRNGIDHGRRESIVNKTALSATTNRKIGGRSPAEYIKIVESTAGIRGDELNKVLSTHLLDPHTLRAADFEAFFAHRRAQLLQLIHQAMGKPAVDTESELPTAFLEEVIDTEVDLEPDPADQPLAADDTSTAPCDGAVEAAFHAAMVDVYRRAKDEAGYPATIFLRMVSERGGMAAARQLLHAFGVSDGFTALWERKRLDLTVEVLILRPEFAPLFTAEELTTARYRLEQYGYSPD